MDIIIVELYKEISEKEKSFTDIQTKYRLLASNCLIATFIGLGFWLPIDSNAIPINKFVGGSLICLMGTIGIILIWILDLLVYQRLLDAVFKEGILLETRYSWLPQVRQNMMKMSGGKGVLNKVVWYYIICCNSLVFLTFLNLLLYLKDEIYLIKIVLTLFFIIVNFTLSYILKKKTMNTYDIISKN